MSSTLPTTARDGDLRAAADLWCMHILGPDDVHAAPDFWTALAWSAEMNDAIARLAIAQNWVADPNYPHTQATVARWPWSPDEHAECLAKELAERAAHAERRRSVLPPPPAQDPVPALGLPDGEVEGLLALYAAVVEAESARQGSDKPHCAYGDWMAAKHRFEAACGETFRTHIFAPPASAADGDGLADAPYFNLERRLREGPPVALPTAEELRRDFDRLATTPPPVPPARVAGLDRATLCRIIRDARIAHLQTPEIADLILAEQAAAAAITIERIGKDRQGVTVVFAHSEYDDEVFRIEEPLPGLLVTLDADGSILHLDIEDLKADMVPPEPTPGETPGQDAVEALAALALDVCEGIENQDGPLPEDSPAGLLRSSARTALASLRSTQADTGGAGQTAAARDVLAERLRQIEVEGWKPQHDDTHDEGEMATAAACYAYVSPLSDHERRKLANEGAPYRWPWDAVWWKPKDARSDLIRAGALILAEIERLDRAAPTPLATDGEG